MNSHNQQTIGIFIALILETLGQRRTVRAKYIGHIVDQRTTEILLILAAVLNLYGNVVRNNTRRNVLDTQHHLTVLDERNGDVNVHAVLRYVLHTELVVIRHVVAGLILHLILQGRHTVGLDRIFQERKRQCRDTSVRTDRLIATITGACGPHTYQCCGCNIKELFHFYNLL